MMKRKDYSKPTMKTVKLHQQCHLLEGSYEAKRGANKQDYESQEW